ncbi:MAG: hypothetical protein AAGI38_09135 [Bacteroidota bacterium]
MKFLYTSLILCIMMVSVTALSAQEVPQLDTKPQISDAYPGLSLPIPEEVISQEKGLKAINAQLVKPGQKGASQEVALQEVFLFDTLGHYTQKVNMVPGDTQAVQYFNYSAGILNWQVYEDRDWNRRYRCGYRFDEEEKIFQVKSYELLTEDDLMLLETEHYVYQDASKPKVVLNIENDEVRKARHYVYDEAGRTTACITRDEVGNVLEEQRYAYGAQSGDKPVSEIHIANNHREEYRYSYGANSRLEGIAFLKDDQLQYKVKYSYDEKGRLTEMKRESKVNPLPYAEVIQLAYEYYQD